MGRRKEVWSKHLVRLVQDSFRIGSDLNESHWFRIGSGIVPYLQGDKLPFPKGFLNCKEISAPLKMESGSIILNKSTDNKNHFMYSKAGIDH